MILLSTQHPVPRDREIKKGTKGKDRIQESGVRRKAKGMNRSYTKYSVDPCTKVHDTSVLFDNPP